MKRRAEKEVVVRGARAEKGQNDTAGWGGLLHAYYRERLWKEEEDRGEGAAPG